jgi:type I restriction-modification system DNA methylase subunit
LIEDIGGLVVTRIQLQRRTRMPLSSVNLGVSVTYAEIVAFIWGVADLIRDTFKRRKYQDVILPLTVLRRLDTVLAPTKEAVLARNAQAGSRHRRAGADAHY